MNREQQIYVTLAGFPLSMKFDWPFHKSQAAADYDVLHGDVRLEDGSELHALIAVHLIRTVSEHLPSLDREHTEAIVINALRKETDRKQLEFIKTGKRQPVPLSTRFMSIRTREFTFEHATDDQVREMLLRKVYWSSKRGSAAWISDPAETLYVGTSVDGLKKSAQALASEGFIVTDGEQASATDKLKGMSEIETQAHQAREALEQKHAYERG